VAHRDPTAALASGLSEPERLQAAAEWGQEFASPMEQAMLAIYQANQEHTWTENLLGEVEDALDRAGLWSKVATTPAICFLDLTGYTRLTEERGDRAAAELVARLTPVVQRPAERHGGKVVKRLGDGVMLHFRNSRDAVLAALEMIDAISAASMPPAHVGVDTGPVVFQGQLLRSNGEHRRQDRRARRARTGSREPGGRGPRRFGRCHLHSGRSLCPERRLPARAPPLGASTRLSAAGDRVDVGIACREPCRWAPTYG
jgi:hypothetical protein